MKGLVIGQKVSVGALQSAHSYKPYLFRLYVPEKENLVFGVYLGEVFAFTGFNPRKDPPDYQMGVSIPDSLVEKALALAHAKADLQKDVDTIRKYVPLDEPQ